MIEQLESNPSSAALNWLGEMELVANPYMLNAMVLNVFRMLPRLKDAQFVVDPRTKKLLIYLELGRWDTWFNVKKIESQVLEMIGSVLPNFTLRVVFDRNILNKALDIVKAQGKQ